MKNRTRKLLGMRPSLYLCGLAKTDHLTEQKSVLKSVYGCEMNTDVGSFPPRRVTEQWTPRMPPF